MPIIAWSTHTSCSTYDTTSIATGGMTTAAWWQDESRLFLVLFASAIFGICDIINARIGQYSNSFDRHKWKDDSTCGS